MMKKTYLLLGTMLLTTAMAFAQAGTLDNTFGTGGSVLTSICAVSNIKDIAIQVDGKIIAVGYCTSTDNNNFIVTRYNTNGTLDDTFGTGGTVSTSIGNGTNSEANAVAVQADGKIVVAGTSNTSIMASTVDFALVRYTTNGTLDNTFGTGGIVTTDFVGYGDYLNSIAIQADGKIVVAGTSSVTSTQTDFALSRYTTTGVLDNTFGTGGKVTTNLGVGLSSEAHSIAIQTDGKIVVAGEYYGTSMSNNVPLVRYTTNGQLDNTFGTDGKVITSLSADNAELYSVALQTDGKIVVAGFIVHDVNNSSSLDFLLMRYSSNGSLDNTFGTAGIVATDFSGNYDGALSLAIQADGKFVVAGGVTASSTSLTLARYASNGTLDTTFGIGGVVRESDAFAFSCDIQSDGKIIIAGVGDFNNSSGAFYVARYLSGLNTGILDFSVDNHSMLVYPNPINSQATLEYTLTQSEVLSAELMDMNGRVVKSFFTNEKRAEGAHKETLFLDESILAGNYMLVLKNGNQHVPIKIIKQ